jgi:copper chaperone CopZ
VEEIMTLETLTFSVRGIHCQNCTERIQQKVSAVPGVKSASVDRDQNLVTVQAESASDAAVRSAIEEAGYRAD